MQLGVIGLGRMGANIVRRLHVARRGGRLAQSSVTSRQRARAGVRPPHRAMSGWARRTTRCRGLSSGVKPCTVIFLMFRASVVVQIVIVASIEAGEGGALG